MAAVHVVQSRTFTPQIRSRSARALRESKRSLHARVLILLRVNKILFAARQPAGCPVVCSHEEPAQVSFGRPGRGTGPEEGKNHIKRPAEGKAGR